MTDLANMQNEIKQIDKDVFSWKLDDQKTLCLRVLEEAFELCQTHDIDFKVLCEVGIQVYNKNKGVSCEEVGDVLISLLNYCNHSLVNLANSYEDQKQKIINNADKIRKKQKLKIHI